MRATVAVIHTDMLRHNLEAVRRIAGEDVKICLPVKADAYGHGAEGIAEAATGMDVDCLAVAAISEAESLRNAGITLPIILLGPVQPEEAADVAGLSLEAVISGPGELKRLEEAAGGKRLSIHLKVDTGMGRLGCSISEAPELAAMIAASDKTVLSGVCSHFPASDSADPEDVSFTRKQIDIFRDIIGKIRAAGIDPGLIHTANSGGFLNHPEAAFDMVRPGIFAYGYLPGGKKGLIRDIGEENMPKPVMSFESKLMNIKKVPAGTDISYGRRYTTRTESWIGTIPVGYADGYNRLLSNRGKVLIGEKLYPVAGTVCMDLMMVDLGPETEAELFDRVVVFGGDKGAMTAGDLAEMTGTISYELLCAISKRVPRIFI